MTGSCWEQAERLLASGGYNRVLFLRPILVESIESGLSSKTSAPFVAAQHQSRGSDDEELPVAVCATGEDHAVHIDPTYPEEWDGQYELEPEGWEWKGVFRYLSTNSPGDIIFKPRYIRII